MKERRQRKAKTRKRERKVMLSRGKRKSGKPSERKDVELTLLILLICAVIDDLHSSYSSRHRASTKYVLVEVTSANEKFSVEFPKNCVGVSRTVTSFIEIEPFSFEVWKKEMERKR
jgi:hypothetical protein